MPAAPSADIRTTMHINRQAGSSGKLQAMAAGHIMCIKRHTVLPHTPRRTNQHMLPGQLARRQLRRSNILFTQSMSPISTRTNRPSTETCLSGQILDASPMHTRRNQCHYSLLHSSKHGRRASSIMDQQGSLMIDIVASSVTTPATLAYSNNMQPMRQQQMGTTGWHRRPMVPSMVKSDFDMV